MARNNIAECIPFAREIRTDCARAWRGQYKNGTLCMPCEAGKYSNKFETTVHVPRSGTYNAVVGAVSVKSCVKRGPGKFGNPTGATSAFDCTDRPEGIASQAGCFAFHLRRPAGKCITFSTVHLKLNSASCPNGYKSTDQIQEPRHLRRHALSAHREGMRVARKLVEKCRSRRYLNVPGSITPDACQTCPSGRFSETLEHQMRVHALNALLIRTQATSGRHQVLLYAMPPGRYTKLAASLVGKRTVSFESQKTSSTLPNICAFRLLF